MVNGREKTSGIYPYSFLHLWPVCMLYSASDNNSYKMKYASLISFSFFCLASLASSAETAIKPYRYADLLVNERVVLPDPMDTSSLSDHVGDVLQIYYKNTFGGADNWQKVESLLIKGKLLTPEGESYEFVNYRKKPDLNKTVVYLENKHKFVTCFDGNDAWQLMTFESGVPESMPTDKSIDFIRDSWLGGHLLSPLLPGKTIEMLGSSKTIGGKLCRQIKISLPNEQSYIISLGAKHYQVAEETVSTVDGSKRYVEQSDFRLVSGIITPFKSKVYSDGALIQEQVLESVEVNQGVMPWMFRRPQ